MNVNNLPSVKLIVATEIMAGLAANAPKTITPKVAAHYAEKAEKLAEALLNRIGN